MDKCTVRVLLFSGRPDPTWEIDESVMQELIKIWDSLVPVSEEIQPDPSLSYRGCLIQCIGDVQLLVFRHRITLRKGGKAETRKDKYRIIEKLIINSAPPGLIPSTLF